MTGLNRREAISTAPRNLFFNFVETAPQRRENFSIFDRREEFVQEEESEEELMRRRCKPGH